MTATIDQALVALARGEMLVVVDSEDRENEATSSWPPSTRRPSAWRSWFGTAAG